MLHNDALVIAGKQFSSRLLLGTGKFASGLLMKQSIEASGTGLVTMALKRLDTKTGKDELLPYLDATVLQLLPNTSGARNAKEAVLCAELAREALGTNWLKLEIHPDPRYLLPDPIETLVAAKELVKKGFIVLPYINADPVLCKLLEDAGTAAVMPLGSPIGSNNGLQTKAMLRIIVEQSNIPVIVDAGIGMPSHAAEAMELGADAVLINTAIATAADPVRMAAAFRLAVEAGREAFLCGPSAAVQHAVASSPFTAFLTHDN
ncbi:MAG TPA: thiazole synthase [Chitinophagales bacterium]|nr:thiazole synthase [Chitinophagales bacterium]